MRETGAGLVFASDGTHTEHSKVRSGGGVEARILPDWQYRGLSWGHYERAHPIPSELSDPVVLRVNPDAESTFY